MPDTQIAVPAPGPHETAIGAVLFDFGGVLADGPFAAFERYERANDLPQGFIRALNSTNHHDNAWARLERGESSFDEFCEAYEQEASSAGGRLDARELFATFTSSTSLRPAMIEAVRRCAQHFKTALLTNNFSLGTNQRANETSDGANDLDDVLALFDVVVESSVTGIRKPDPRFYLLACEALDVEPGRSVFLDDLGINLKPARELGMVTIKVVDPDEALRELEHVLRIPLR